MRGIQETVVQEVIFIDTVIGPDIDLSLLQYFDAADGAVLYRQRVFQQVVMLDDLSRLDIHQVDAVDNVSDPEPVA